MITIYTDGACRGNQKHLNSGGWGYMMKDLTSGKQRQRWGHVPNTTNNRMELTAAIRALNAIRQRPATKVVIYSDSSLLVRGMNEWLTNWVSNGWRNSKNKPIENRELWERLVELSAFHEVTWQHVKGHAGNDGNEQADQLANLGADGLSGYKDEIAA